jgi:hypothetical protein
MMERGELNTRVRDFADVWALSRLHAIDGDRLRTTLLAVVEHRQHAVEPLSLALADRIASRATTRSAHGLRFALSPPHRWTDLVADATAFVDLLLGAADGSWSWNPKTMRWE